MADVFVVVATADRTAPGSDVDSGWTASADAPPAVQGLFAFGDSFADARKNLATVIWEVIKTGGVEGVTIVDVSGIRVLCMTRKTFSTELLEQAA